MTCLAKATHHALRPDQPFGEAMTALIAPRWEKVWREIDRVTKRPDDADAIHDVRVASRRLRAAMDIAAPCFPGAWFDKLSKAAKDITSALGNVRDYDVLLEQLAADRDATAAGDRPAFDEMIGQLDQERDAAREALRDFLFDLERRDIRSETQHRFPSQPDQSKPDQHGQTEANA